MSRLVVIPARMGSSRFPGKPLASIKGKPMIQWVSENAVSAVGIDNVVLATCDEQIADAAQEMGLKFVMTSSRHDRATDRTSEAVTLLESSGLVVENVVMLQGDEPTISAKAVRSVFEYMERDVEPQIVNLISEIRSESLFRDPNCIKIALSNDSTALYMSRSPIPHGNLGQDLYGYKQVCAIGFSRAALDEFSTMKPTKLEESESIDMLRWLENGRKIGLIQSFEETHPVDVLEDVSLVERILERRGT